MSFPTATIVWIVFIIVWQRFEDYVVQPLVYGQALRVNPIVTILSVLAGASLLGILGALLAIPTAAAIQIVLRDWWDKGESSAGKGSITACSAALSVRVQAIAPAKETHYERAGSGAQTDQLRLGSRTD